jgi:uncharacterized metal-binding protein YceD (DUF177 family)
VSFSRSYNLARLGNTGDTVRLEADADERAAIAAQAGALSVERFTADVVLKKEGAANFLLSYTLEVEVTQACVVSLEPVPAWIARSFGRELHFRGTGRHAAETPVTLEISPEEGDEMEEIESLHFDLAAPLLEEFLLALEPYPRRPGVEFDPGDEGSARPESPFAALKSLKPST